MKEKQIKQLEFYVEGMHCAACELFIERTVGQIEGVKSADAQLKFQKLVIKANDDITIDQLNAALSDSNYRVVKNLSENIRKSFAIKDFVLPLIISLVAVAIFAILQRLDVINLVQTETITLPFVFLIGIIASISTCMAVVGGLVLSISANYAKSEAKWQPLVSFHLSRLVAFFFLGGLIGFIGSAFTLSPLAIFILNILLFTVMLLLAFNLLDLFPSLKVFQIKLPKGISKTMLSLNQQNSMLAPVFLGMITFFLPCGFTQSMQLYSLTSGNPVTAALTMLVFALGTFPALAAISFFSVKFSQGKNSKLFFRTAGFLIICFALFSFYSALIGVGVIRPF